MDLKNMTKQELADLIESVQSELVARDNQALLDRDLDVWVAQHRDILGASTHTDRLTWDGEILTFQTLSVEDDPDVPEPEPEFPVWEPGLYLQVGDIITYNGHTYQVLHEHSAHSGWLPSDPATHSVFRRLK